MAKSNDVGVYQLDNGMWGFRFVMVVDGKRISQRKSTDEQGNKITTKNQAIKARQTAMVQVRTERVQKQKIARRKFKEVYAEFCEKGRSDRAYQTKRKQDSIWDNHLCARFGNRYVDEISSGEVNDYLTELYCVEGYSHQYTESFLKMFYLILGQAYSRNYLEVDMLYPSIP